MINLQFLGTFISNIRHWKHFGPAVAVKNMPFLSHLGSFLVTFGHFWSLFNFQFSSEIQIELGPLLIIIGGGVPQSLEGGGPLFDHHWGYPQSLGGGTQSLEGVPHHCSSFERRGGGTPPSIITFGT